MSHIDTAIRLNVDVDETTLDLLAEGNGIAWAENAARAVLGIWAKEQQRLFKQRLTLRTPEKSLVLSGK
jgi:hypothetical protein